MLNLHKLKIRPFVKELGRAYTLSFGSLNSDIGEILAWAGNLALENLANSDALYHDIDHSILVTLAGQEILKGRQLNRGGINPQDWLNFVVALLCHDIGYVKGVCLKDRTGKYDDGFGNIVDIDENGTCALLAPYHVARAQLFIKERFGKNPMLDSKVVCSYIEMTRFPIPKGMALKDKEGLHGLVRAADFIGQLGDPNYLLKIPRLYFEFEELGMNEIFGYNSPGEMRTSFAKFFWDEVTPYIQPALRYLEVTQEGKEWITNLHSQVFTSENYKRMEQKANDEKPTLKRPKTARRKRPASKAKKS